jgi:hypothetical protein
MRDNVAADAARPGAPAAPERKSGPRVRSFRAGAVVGWYLGLAACQPSAPGAHTPHPVVGTWLVTIPEAPFPLHMFAFHADGTVQQSNPDAGDPNSSDSSAMGVWVADHDKVRGKIVEVTADRGTHQFLSRGEIAFSLKVEGNALRGSAVAVFYDGNGEKVRGPVTATLKGQRVLP